MRQACAASLSQMEPMNRHFKGRVMCDDCWGVISWSRPVCRSDASGAVKLADRLAEYQRSALHCSMNTSPLLIAQTTCASSDDAERLARGLVDARLAACVSIGAPVRSVYPWQGRIETETEVPLTIKTSQAKLPALKSFMVENHNYEVPELLVTPVVDGHEPYLSWAGEWLQG